MDADAIVIGAGLAGLVATSELARAGRRVLLLEQEPESNLGGQAFWAFGGLFMVGTPEQRRMGIKDSPALAWQDWQGSAFFDRDPDDPAGEDYWASRWARAYVDFAAGEKRAWLHALGVRWFPLVGWAERGGYLADGHGNSVPRFHVTWGSGPALVAPFERRVREAAAGGRAGLRFRHRVDALTVTGGNVDGVRGAILEPSPAARGTGSSRAVTGEFELHAPVVIVTSGGIGGNLDLVRENWPERLGPAPERMIIGVPEHVDGRMLAIAERAGGRLVNRDRMWHYTEGVQNWDPIWAGHGIRILPGPSSLWFDARGQRFPAPHFPGFDSLGTLGAIRATGFDYSWFVTTQKIVEKEFALSGSEQNPDLTGKDIKLTLSRVRPGAPAPVEAFKRHGADFVVARTLAELVAGMNKLTPEPLIELADLERQIVARDREIDNPFTKDLQVMAIRNARRSRGERIARTAAPHKILDPKAGPLIAVRLNILTRKTLGGLQTDLSGRVIGRGPERQPVPGLYAAGEVAGFGGGGMHGYRSLEGSFLGGCLFSGREAGRAAARATAGLAAWRGPQRRVPAGWLSRRQANRRWSSSSMASAPSFIAVSLSWALATSSATSLTDASRTWASVPASSGRSLPCPAMTCRIALIPPRACCSSIARHRSQPSTDGASISRIRCTTGSPASRIQARDPARSAATGPSAPAAAARVRAPTLVSTPSATASNRASLLGKW
jgi:uncharacterized protein